MAMATGLGLAALHDAKNRTVYRKKREAVENNLRDQGYRFIGNDKFVKDKYRKYYNSHGQETKKQIIGQDIQRLPNWDDYSFFSINY